MYGISLSGDRWDLSKIFESVWLHQHVQLFFTHVALSPPWSPTPVPLHLRPQRTQWLGQPNKSRQYLPLMGTNHTPHWQPQPQWTLQCELYMLKQYSTLRSGTATPTHLLGGVHRGDDSGSWLRAVILCQRCPLFIYNKECDMWLDHMTCDMCCLL